MRQIVQRFAGRAGSVASAADLALLSLAVGLANLSLLAGAGPSRGLVFLPGPFLAGEWWRLLTHPFVHVSPYHLLLDAGAFFWLYSLVQGGPGRRLALAAAAAAGSLAAAAFAPGFAGLGLCGLSGVAHGLMAVVGVQALRAEDGRSRAVGACMLLAVVLKGAFEALTGGVFFLGLHPGSVGAPNPLCHAGGIVGALAAWGSSGQARRSPSPSSRVRGRFW